MRDFEAACGFEANEIIGIIGANVSGNTTLLRIIACEEQPDSRRVVLMDGKALAFMSQNPPLQQDVTVLETIFNASGGVMKTIRDYEAACGFEANEKIGIIGANGSGKTTLLRIIACEEQPDSGRVVLMDGKALAFLSQNPPLQQDVNVLETIFNASGGVMKT